MKKLSVWVPVILLGYLLAVSASYPLLYLFGLVFVPTNDIVYCIAHALFVACIVWLTAITCKHRDAFSKPSSVAAALSPLFAFLYIIINNIGASKGVTAEFIIIALDVLVLVCGYIIFFVNQRIQKTVKLIFALLYGLLITLLLLVLGVMAFLAVIMGDFGSTTVMKSLPSPDGVYLAELISSDQGALGGSTHVIVTDVKHVLHLGVGRIQRQPEYVYRGSYGAVFSLEMHWESDSTLVINGDAYNINE